MSATVANGNGVANDVSSAAAALKKGKPPALKKLPSWKEDDFDASGNPKTPRTSTTPGNNNNQFS